MKTSTEFDSIAKLSSEEKAIKLIARAGFDAWDFSMFTFKYNWTDKTATKIDGPFFSDNYLAYARKLKQIGLDNGIVCNQSHAPFPTNSPLIASYLKRAIECTAEAGGQYCIIHPHTSLSIKENAELYADLVEFGKQHNVRIATENMYGWDKEKGHAVPSVCGTEESFLSLLNAVDDDYFVACCDVGHASMLGDETSPEKMIRALGSKCQALHLQDTDLLHDLHQPPFTQKMDFEAIVKALYDINYSGYFTLEAPYYLKDFTSDNVFDAVKDLYSSAKKLADMFDALQQNG